MIRTMRRARLLWLTLACATIAGGLAGCGGGGGGSTPPPPPPPPPPAAESAYLLAEFVATDSNNQFVRVWDPANPAVAVQNVRIVQSNGIVWQASHLVFSEATSWDATSRTVTTLGHAKVFFDNDGKLYSIDLRGGHAHAPVQLSSAVDVFSPVQAWPMDAAGDDAWVDVQGGSHDWAIRTSMAATAAPVNVRHVIAPLRDAATGLPQYFFASLGDDGIHPVDATYEVADAATFAPIAVPEVAGMVAADGWIGADPGQPGLGYVGIANQVRTLHWSAGGISVAATNLHTLSGLTLTPAVADAQSVYVSDAGTLLALGGGSVHAVGTFSAAPASLMDAGGYVAAYEVTQVVGVTPQVQVETLAKSGGALVLVQGSTPDLRLLAGGDDGVLLTNTSDQHDAFVLARGDGTARTTLGSTYVGIVRAASGRADQPAAPVGLLSCVAGTVPGWCAAGTLTQFTLTGAATALGSNAATSALWRGDAVAGVVSPLSGQNTLSSPAGFGDGETDVRDAWQFTPGGASSLTRVTSSLP
jgi:hypothetical protein